MIRRPPRSKLFPSTTFFRLDVPVRAVVGQHHPVRLERLEDHPSLGAEAREVDARLEPHPRAHRWHAGRSEEHTSELQSHQYLVCRLLLEKKNNDSSPMILIP